MLKVIYGQAGNHEHYAVAYDGGPVWEESEVTGLPYYQCDFDEIPEANWDRVSVLEEKLRERAAGNARYQNNLRLRLGRKQ